MFAIITVGLNHSGKSYVAHKLAETNEQCIVLENDVFRSLIRKNPNLNTIYKKSQTEHASFSDPDLMISYITHTIQYCKQYQCIPIVANVNGRGYRRKGLIEYLQKQGYKVIVIYCNPPLELIQQRIQVAKDTKDPILFTGGVEQSFEKSKAIFEIPHQDEGDYFREITDDHSFNNTIQQINILIQNSLAP